MNVRPRVHGNRVPRLPRLPRLLPLLMLPLLPLLPLLLLLLPLLLLLLLLLLFLLMLLLMLLKQCLKSARGRGLAKLARVGHPTSILTGGKPPETARFSPGEALQRKNRWLPQ